MATRLVEAHGGVVEKFIGDAVVAVFGFPAAHDDDAERAVRCAFRLVEEVGQLAWPDDDAVQVHIGVNSGEIYLHTDVDPSSGGSFLTGDAVNTAARLEAASPPNGIVLGALTHELTKHTIAYEELEPLQVKGKKEPVRAWLAKELQQARSRTGIRTSGSPDTPFVGREKELKGLVSAFDRGVASGKSQCILLMGEPGIGKSRLVLEFARALDDRPELVTWRQGRCPAYGQSLSFAALADIIKAHAGILDSDEVSTVEEKLEAALPEGEDQPWLRQRLRALVGLEAAPGSQEENFAAWTRILERLASGGGAVLVVEDVHWADEGTLAFLDHLASRQLAVPLLLLVTTRPELLARRPQGSALIAGARRFHLAPLQERESGLLISGLLDARLASTVRHAILEHVGGNPLYAEEYVRLLLDRGLLVKAAGRRMLKEGEQLPLPDSVQAVLQARLDTLPPEHKALLCDAAVFGETFWDGGLAAVSNAAPDRVREALARLGERQLIRPASWSSLAGQTEYLFWHALARDVAYAELPKRSRLDKHVATAEWLEVEAAERADEQAEVLAYHYDTALQLAEAVRDDARRKALVEPTVRCLETAAKRAYFSGLSVDSARRFASRGMELVGARRADHPRLLMAWAAFVADDDGMEKSLPIMEEAAAAFLASGEPRAAAEALSYVATGRERLGRCDCLQPITQALRLLEGDEPSIEMIGVLAHAANDECNLGKPERALDFAERAVGASRRLGLEGGAERNAALMARGTARCQLGDARGLDDLYEAREDLIPFATYAQQTFLVQGPAAGVPLLRQAVRLAGERGFAEHELMNKLCLLEAEIAAGFWQEAVSKGRELVCELDALDLALYSSVTRCVMALLLSKRADVATARSLADRGLQVLMSAAYPSHTVMAYFAAAATLVRDDLSRATGLLEEGACGLEASLAYWQIFDVPESVRLALRCGQDALARRIVGLLTLDLPSHVCTREYTEALLREASDDREKASAGFTDAAGAWRELGIPYEEAQALLGQGRCLVALGKAGEAAGPLQKAREIFERLGAKPAMQETEVWLSKTPSAL